MDPAALGLQMGMAAGYYFALLIVARIAGKRLAGQTTTIDLIVLIGLAVVAQNLALQPGAVNALIFIVTVLATHRAISYLCTRYRGVRHLLRGRPRALVRDGLIVESALRDEGLSVDELLAGLRKLGYESPAKVRVAVLEETGHISAIAAPEGK